MNKNKLIVGKQYNVKLFGEIYKLYYLEQADGYDHSCDCCGKDTMNGFIFCKKYYKESHLKSWESNVYFIGGSSCLKKFVNNID